MNKCFLFLFTNLFLVLISSSSSSAGETLKPKWTKEGIGYVGICKPGKLIMANNGPAGVLLDLTNGEILWQTKPDSNEFFVYTNYSGSKFYVPVNNKGIFDLKEYDTKTKQYLRTIPNSYLPNSPLDEFGYYNPDTKSFVFYKAFTKELIDSIYYLPSFDIVNQKEEFTIDNKYFAISLIEGLTPHFFLYDRSKREFIIQNKLDFNYCLFNKSNKLAYAEKMKLSGDDTIYSYIRIYDLDQRKVIQDIKIAKANINNLIIRMDDSYILYELNDDYNTKGVFNLISNQILNNNLKPIGSPFRYADSTIIIAAGTGFFCGNIYDWITGIKDNSTNEDTVIYPNPADNTITVTIPEQYYSGNWNISDLTGKTIKKGVILLQNRLQIDISQLLPQTYYLTIRKENNSKTFSIVKK